MMLIDDQLLRKAKYGLTSRDRDEAVAALLKRGWHLSMVERYTKRAEHIAHTRCESCGFDKDCALYRAPDGREAWLCLTGVTFDSCATFAESEGCTRVGD